MHCFFNWESHLKITTLSSKTTEEIKTRESGHIVKSAFCMPKLLTWSLKCHNGKLSCTLKMDLPSLIKWVLHLHIMNLVTSFVTPRAISFIKFDEKIGEAELARILRSNFGLSKKLSDIWRVLGGEGMVIIFFSTQLGGRLYVRKLEQSVLNYRVAQKILLEIFFNVIRFFF